MAAGARAVAQLASECLLKAAEVVRDARSCSSPASATARPNRWFHLELADRSEGALGAWRADSTVAPLVLEVLLLPHAPGGGDATPSAPGGSMVLLERWVFAHERAADAAGADSPPSLPRRPSLFESARSLEAPVIYKRMVIMLRSLYALLRTLPTHRAALACKSNAACPFTLVCEVRAPTSAPRPDFQPEQRARFEFTSVQTPVGNVTASVEYLSEVAALQALSAYADVLLSVPRAAPSAPRAIMHAAALLEPLHDYLGGSAGARSDAQAAARGAVSLRRNSWSLSTAAPQPQATHVPLTIDVEGTRSCTGSAAALAADDASWTNRSTAPVSIPGRPSVDYLDSAEQHMGGSPLTGRPPFAGTSAPRAGSSASAARQAQAYAAARALQQSGPGSCTALSVSPRMPFAFTPQPLSASSLASGLHPLAQMPSPPASSAGSADAYGRFALALRRSSWSPASSLTVSSSLVGMSSASPVLDASVVLSSPPLTVPLQRLTYHAAGCSPDDGGLESEPEPLPFALEDVFSADTAAEEASPSPTGAHSARVDAAVGALVRLMQDAPPLRSVQGCSLREALCELELYQAASRRA